MKKPTQPGFRYQKQMGWQDAREHELCGSFVKPLLFKFCCMNPWHSSPSSLGLLEPELYFDGGRPGTNRKKSKCTLPRTLCSLAATGLLARIAVNHSYYSPFQLSVLPTQIGYRCKNVVFLEVLDYNFYDLNQHIHDDSCNPTYLENTGLGMVENWKYLESCIKYIQLQFRVLGSKV